MNELVDFLLARIGEDEDVARAATEGPWRASELWNNVPDGDPDDRIVEWSVDCHPCRIVPDDKDPAGFRIEPSDWNDVVAHGTVASSETDPGGNFEHVARHDPARVLAECDSKRRIVERCIAAESLGRTLDAEHARQWLNAQEAMASETLRLLALPYAGHPSYRSEWAP